MNIYPLEVGQFREKVNNSQEFYNYVNLNNGKKTLFNSIYDISNFYLNKIVFDFDNGNALQSTIKLHNFLKNIKHLITFSGNRGFHIYIFTKNYENILNKKDCLANVHWHFINALNLKDDVDTHLVGNPRAMIRTPNTVHLSSKLYCIPITIEDLKLGIEHIKNKAQQQNFTFTYYGNELLDIKQFDTNFKQENNNFIQLNPDIAIEINKNVILKQFQECITNLLLKPYIFYNERLIIHNYLLNQGYSDIEIDNVMKAFLQNKKHPEKNMDNYEAWLRDIKKKKQLQYFRQKNYFFSFKNSIINKGFCVKCKHFNEGNCLAQKEIYV